MLVITRGYWLVVSTSLKNMKVDELVSWDYDIPN